MNKKTLNFEIFINENEKVTITIDPDFKSGTYEITGITQDDNTMVQLQDLGQLTQTVIEASAYNYFKHVISL